MVHYYLRTLPPFITNPIMVKPHFNCIDNNAFLNIILQAKTKIEFFI